MDKHDFKVGDGVSFGCGSDRYPGTVVRVTPTRVHVASDDYECTSPPSAYGSNDGVYRFTPVKDAAVQVFTVKKNGRVSMKGGNYGILGHGRCYYQDPSF